jgi:tetratricopeptide (TPR) repeat protein
VRLALAFLLLATPLAAQVDSLNRAFDLERRGNYAAAVTAYRAVLKSRPSEVSALLGLERSLTPLNRTAEMVPDIGVALAANPSATALYGVAVRTYGAANMPDSLRRAVEKWAQLAPKDETPYREWGNALLARKDRAGARAAYMAGRQQLGPTALAPELAQLAVLEGDYPGAAREWLVAVKKLPGYRSGAVVTLRLTPDAQRAAVLKVLDADGSPDALRLDAELRARWGDPVGGFERLSQVLPADPVESRDLLRQFAEALRGNTAPAYRQAMGRALEAMAQRTNGAQRSRLQLDAAQAYLDGGDRTAARRMLAGLASDGESPAALSASASGTLLRLLVEEGKMEEAEKSLAQYRGVLSTQEMATLTRRVAMGWARAGKLDRAEALAASDSSVDGLALRGQLKLFQGDIAGAVELLRAAGPYAGTREQATARTSLLALLQPIEVDTLPALGDAFMLLERGDTAGAVKGLTTLGASQPRNKGGAELLLLAGRLEAARGQRPAAEKLFRAAVDTTAPATAPAALLELGRLLASSGRGGEAVPVFEQLILDYPRSALVPQARRALDEAKGAVPQ